MIRDVKIIVESAPDSHGRQRFTIEWQTEPRSPPDKFHPNDTGKRGQCFNARLDEYLRQYARDASLLRS